MLNVLDYCYCDPLWIPPHTIPACVHLFIYKLGAMLRGSQTITFYTELTSLVYHSIIGWMVDNNWWASDTASFSWSLELLIPVGAEQICCHFSSLFEFIELRSCSYLTRERQLPHLLRCGMWSPNHSHACKPVPWSFPSNIWTWEVWWISSSSVHPKRVRYAVYVKLDVCLTDLCMAAKCVLPLFFFSIYDV